jgi:hypothetical protein
VLLLLYAQAVIGNQQADHSARWLAAVQLKNSVNKYWRPRYDSGCACRTIVAAAAASLPSAAQSNGLPWQHHHIFAALNIPVLFDHCMPVQATISCVCLNRLWAIKIVSSSCFLVRLITWHFSVLTAAEEGTSYTVITHIALANLTLSPAPYVAVLCSGV